MFDWATPSFATQLGFSPDTVRAQGGWRSLVHVDDWPLVLQRIPLLLAGQGAVSEYRVRAATGEWRWLRDRARPLPDRTGSREIAIVGAIRDITAQKTAQAALTDSESILRSLFDSAPFMMGVIEVAGDDLVFISANAAAARYLDQTPEALKHQRVSSFGIEPEVIQLAVQQLAESRRSARPVRFEFQYPTGRNGQWWSILLASIGGTHYSLFVVDDITRRQHFEDALRVNEHKFRSFMEQSFDGMALVGEDGRVVEWNQALEKITGVVRKQAVGQSYLALLLLLTPDDNKAVMAEDLERMVMEALNTGAADFLNHVTEWPSQRVDDPHTRRVWQHAAFPIRTGERYRLGIIIRDITARKHTEQLLRIQRDLGIVLSAASKLHPALHEILRAVFQIESITAGGVYGVDETTGAIQLHAQQGLPPEFVQRASYYPADSPQAAVVQAGRPIYSRYADLLDRLGLDYSAAGLRAIAVIPVMHNGRPIAVLNAASHQLDELPAEVCEALEAIAARVGSTIARIRAEESLAASQRNLQALFDQIGDFIFVVDMQGRIVHANAAVYQRLGYSAAELLGQSVLVVHPAERQAEARRVLEAMLAGEAQVCPVPLQTKDGQLIPIETRVTRGQWNKQAALFGVSRPLD
ncbi:MAG: PAS domain S-box protein [Chloroflexi bacterium]|nr:PAS domain S-box protein [Chloroflexota bacterium]